MVLNESPAATTPMSAIVPYLIASAIACATAFNAAAGRCHVGTSVG
jgi:hypothetical protein